MSPFLRIALLVDPLSALVGSGRHAFELSRELVRRGHEVRAFGMPPALLEGVDGAARATPVKLGASVALFDPDALLAYDALSPAAWVGARVARRRGAPLVLVEAGSWDSRGRLQRALWRVGESLWGRQVRRTAGAVVALDPVAREALLRRGFAADAVRLVPHGVDLEQFRPGLASAELARHRVRGRILACRSSFDRPAELEHLFEAFAATVGQRDDWSLVAIGDQPPPAQLRVAAQRLGVGPRVHLLALGERELPALLSSSTLFAVPCESGGQALLDIARAQACGVPVLALDSARARSLVRDDDNGLLVRDGGVEAWTDALRRVGRSPECRRRWSRAARRFAEERLGWPAVAAGFELLLLSPPSGAPDGARAALDSRPQAAG